MELANVLFYASTVSYCIALVLLVIMIFLWFKLKIWNVFNDLSGRTIRKEIEQMRANNGKTGEKIYKSSSINMGRGKLNDAIKMELSILGTEKVEPITCSTPTETLSEVGGDAEFIEFEIVDSKIIIHTEDAIV